MCGLNREEESGMQANIRMETHPDSLNIPIDQFRIRSSREGQGKREEDAS